MPSPVHIWDRVDLMYIPIMLINLSNDRIVLERNALMGIVSTLHDMEVSPFHEGTWLGNLNGMPSDFC